MMQLPVIMLRGILIGILVSAPMGPIGMLCIQRTLSRGRWPAFFTGVGAGVSDLVYCLLTGLGDFGTGFLFTFSNPLILFFIIGLFARFSFLAPEFESYHYAAGYLAIFGGAVMWWFGVTWFVNKVRGHFNLRSMWLVNRIVAGVILVMGAIGFLTALRDLIIK
ncbi:MAG: LysE family translocator [Muribaculaceae bacterium]|nr:LysE family translocator [Muribaculaceae bacterium]